jgi:hypothetical protein
MSPILTGVIASGISGNLTPPWSPQGGYDALNAVTLSTSAASITFSNIPADYKHLQIRWIARNTDASQNTLYARMNDISSSYAHHLIYGGAAEGIGSEVGFPSDSFFLGSISNSNRAANCFSSGVADILDYSSTSKLKVVRSISGRDDNTNGIFIVSSSGYFGGTQAIESLTLTSAGNLTANSHFALYGIR